MLKHDQDVVIEYLETALEDCEANSDAAFHIRTALQLLADRN